MNDRSELVTPTNFSDGGVLDTSRRFHAAWPASMSPALSPTRGSLPGAGADSRPPPLLDEAHAARENTAIASESERKGPRAVTADSMADSCEGMRARGRLRDDGLLMGCAPRARGGRASAACGRFR